MVHRNGGSTASVSIGSGMSHSISGNSTDRAGDDIRPAAIVANVVFPGVSAWV